MEQYKVAIITQVVTCAEVAHVVISSVVLYYY